MRRGGRSVPSPRRGLAWGGSAPPTITNPGPQKATVGVALELLISATGATSYAASGLPAGLAISPSTGVITGAPTMVETDSATVTVKGPGGEASATFEWVVSVALPPEPEPEPGLSTAPDFEEALVDLQDHLPYWWASRDPDSALYSLLVPVGTLLDELAWLFEEPFLNSVLETANEQGLLRNFAFAYGLENEQLPPTTERLREYIRACSEMDGSLQGLIRILMAIIGAEAAVNTTGGSILTFPGSGGLTFPSNGEGLALFQFEAGHGPSGGLTFPANGAGLVFPESSSALPSDNVIGDTGGTPPGAGPGLTFAQNEYLLITQNSPSTNEFTVEVLSWLTFNRSTFRRAIERYQPADSLPGIVLEVSALA